MLFCCNRTIVLSNNIHNKPFETMTTPNDPLEFKNSIPIHDQKFLEKQNQFLPGQKLQ